MSDVSDLPRTIPLEGASNVRDLGGYRTKDGRHVRFGRVFRAAALSNLTDADGAALRAAGIGVVCDLRGSAESEAAPSKLDGVTIHPLSIDPSLGSRLREIAAEREATEDEIVEVMCNAYAQYALTWSHRYRQLFDLLDAADDQAVLFHCTAGKDRTGFGAALILAALGVDRATVHTDYLATNRLWTGAAAVGASLAPNVAKVLTRVQPDFIDAAFNAVKASHGSVDAYLQDRIGLDTSRRAALRARMLE